jgi:phosphatidylserine/phosphatidylglycerophosphate/cardiolipin synthase-like enzyme
VKGRWLPLLILSVVACAPPADPGDDDEIDDDDAPVTEPDPVDDPLVIEAAQVALAPGCVAHAPLAGHSTWLFFTRPDRPCKGTAGSGVDRNAVDELARLIGTVPAGGRIDGHIFGISVSAIGKALLDAQTRGVDVRISTDGAVASSTAAVKTRFLDKLTHKVYCKHARNRACISTAAGAISHTKLFAFSTASAPDGSVASDVVWFGSANQMYASGTQLYNNTVTVYGDGSLYTQLRSYLGDLFAQRRFADYYDPASGSGHFLAPSADVYASPELQTDLVVDRLDNITPDTGCRVRVIQAEVRDSRLAVVDQLVKMKRGGCQIWVVADTVEPRALSALHAAKIPVHKMPIHDKSFLVFGKVGATSEYRVYTGSHNLTSGAAHRNDEIFVGLTPETDDAHPVYDAYLTHFNDAYHTGVAL